MASLFEIRTPIERELIGGLKIGSRISISGRIYTGRDTALPKLVRIYKEGGLCSLGIELEGSVVFHTAVSPAGVGPTSSNKAEIEESMPVLAKAGARIHLGKGALSPATIAALAEYGSVYAVVPPVTALLESKITNRSVVAFEEDGMEAVYMLEVDGFPAIVAAAGGESIYI